NTIATLTLNGGTLTGPDGLTVTGLTTWSNGTMSGSGITNANGGVRKGPAGAVVETRGGEVGGQKSGGGGPRAPVFSSAQRGRVGELNVEGGGVWNIVNDGGVQNNGGTTPVINNAGTFEKTAGTGTTSIGASFNNNTGGTVAANSGTLSLNGGGTGVGTYSI